MEPFRSWGGRAPGTTSTPSSTPVRQTPSGSNSPGCSPAIRPQPAVLPFRPSAPGCLCCACWSKSRGEPGGPTEEQPADEPVAEVARAGIGVVLTGSVEWRDATPHAPAQWVLVQGRAAPGRVGGRVARYLARLVKARGALTHDAALWRRLRASTSANAASSIAPPGGWRLPGMTQPHPPASPSPPVALAGPPVFAVVAP